MPQIITAESEKLYTSVATGQSFTKKEWEIIINIGKESGDAPEETSFERMCIMGRLVEAK